MQIKPTGFRVASWAAWTPDFDSGEVPNVPQSLKRRIGKTGQKALAAAWGIGAKDARIVFSSRHGDFVRSFSLMDSLAKTGEVSPADFTLSVHHGLVGLLSIAQGNQRGHSAISAGAESFCYGLLEAIACLKQNPDEQVLLIHCDDPLPEPFAQFNDKGEQPVALVLLLENGNDFSFSTSSPLPQGGAGGGESRSLSTSPDASPSPNPLPEEEGFCSTPALDFLQILRGQAKDKISNCRTASWHWTKNAA